MQWMICFRALNHLMVSRFRLMNSQYTHVLKNIQPIIDAPDEDRIYFLQEEKWIPYSLAKDVLARMDSLMKYPRKSRMPSMLLVGETNNGKTSILNRFLHLHPPLSHEDAVETTKIRVISIQAPPGGNLNELYTNILKQFAVPYKNTDKIAKKQQQVEYYFGLCQLKILIIDEIHNILSAPTAKQTIFMNTLKTLSNTLQISIIIAGTKDALYATNTNTQINNRFKPVFLPKWQLDREYLALLASIESTLPLKKASNLASSKKMAQKILDLTEGYIGEMFDLITLSAEYAIKNKVEQITLDTIKKSGYIKPSLRKSFDDMVQL